MNKHSDVNRVGLQFYTRSQCDPGTAKALEPEICAPSVRASLLNAQPGRRRQ